MTDREIKFLMIAVEEDSIWLVEPNDMEVFNSDENQALDGAWKPWEAQLSKDAVMEQLAEFIGVV